MLIDANVMPRDSELDTDICIIGAGAAGITFAMEWAGSPFRVCLLESGSFDLDSDTQELYRGTVADGHALPLDQMRLRYFGGSTNHWSGRCRPLDEMDFQERPWIPFSGWPIDKAHLAPYYRKAETYCQMREFDYEVAPALFDNPLAASAETLQLGAFQYSAPTHFGTVYRNQVIGASNTTVCLNANVTEIVAAENGAQIERLAVATLHGNRFSVRANMYILATGGIENARLLLASNSRIPGGLGNGNDLVGRFFSDHPTIWEAGWIFFSEPKQALGNFIRINSEGRETAPFFCPSPEVQEREAILNCGFDFRSNPFSSPGASSFKVLGRELSKGKVPDGFFQHVGRVVTDLKGVGSSAWATIFPDNAPIEVDPRHAFLVRYWGEPAPNPDSRVTLGADRDKLGMPKVQLDWRMNDLDRHTFARTLDLLGLELGRTGVGRFRIGVGQEVSEVFDQFVSAEHAMGTTRMHKELDKGVVDADCRVHGIGNLYVAGSSVFPSSGHANPTLTLVAMAIRLADHIKQKMV